MTDVHATYLPTDLKQILTSKQAWHYQIVPKEVTENHIAFYTPPNSPVEQLTDELELIFGKTIELQPIAAEQLKQLLSKNYRNGGESLSIQGRGFEGAKLEKWINNLISEAKGMGCSDIHIEAYKEQARIRFRLDGHLVEKYVFDKTHYPSIINQIKIKAHLDIAEKRLPQDGRIQHVDGEKKFDIRISFVPTLHGEKAVLRLLDKEASQLDLEKCGLKDKQLSDYLKSVKRLTGIVLISGPTGSGKTTTLYSTLGLLNNVARNIVTIEDPIEYTLPGINQVQLNEGIGLTFPKALKTFLRQDPDVIMLGEIRDKDTASMAIRAALTGHLVLSTVHTNSAWGIIARLLDMNIPSFLLASTLNALVAQRLLRKLCVHCKRKEPLDLKKHPEIKLPHNPRMHYLAKGCEACHYTGYAGRTAIYEIIAIDKEVQQHIQTSRTDASKLLAEKQVLTLRQAAIEKFRTGVTSLEEIAPILLTEQ